MAPELVGGRYRLEGPLGRGGMAVVYRARHVGTDKLCALKVILPKLAARKHLVELFHAEARIGAKIGDHPHIVNVFDAGVDEATGLPFLAMELLDGETLLLAAVQRIVIRPQPRGQAVDPSSDVAKAFDWATRILEQPATTLWLDEEQDESFRLVAEGVSLGGAAFTSARPSPREMAFVAGRAVTAASPLRSLRWRFDTEALSDIFLAAVAVVAPRARALLTDGGQRWLRLLDTGLNERERAALERAAQKLIAAGGTTHLGMWAQGAEHTAARAGLLLADDIGLAAHVLDHHAVPRLRELGADLIAFFTSRDYRALRETMGLAPPRA